MRRWICGYPFDQIFTGIINAKYHFDGGSSIGIFVSTLKYNNPIYTFGLKNLLDVFINTIPCIDQGLLGLPD